MYSKNKNSKYMLAISKCKKYNLILRKVIKRRCLYEEKQYAEKQDK